MICLVKPYHSDLKFKSFILRTFNALLREGRNKTIKPFAYRLQYQICSRTCFNLKTMCTKLYIYSVLYSVCYDQVESPRFYDYNLLNSIQEKRFCLNVWSRHNMFEKHSALIT